MAIGEWIESASVEGGAFLQKAFLGGDVFSLTEPWPSYQHPMLAMNDLLDDAAQVLTLLIKHHPFLIVTLHPDFTRVTTDTIPKRAIERVLLPRGIKEEYGIFMLNTGISTQLLDELAKIQLRNLQSLIFQQSMLLMPVSDVLSEHSMR